MKLNMGCGHHKRPGCVNVDIAPACEANVVCDLETFPWPWDSGSVEEVFFIHSLEHLGEDSRIFLGMIKELYRICKPGARIVVLVPHPRHDDFINDPTHVRPITPGMLALLDRQLNDEWKRTNASNTKLAYYLDVDFHIVDVKVMLSEPYATQHRDKLISTADPDAMARELNNIVSEYRIVMGARKDG